MPTDTRDRDLRIRVNPQERAQLDKAAERFGLPTSTLVRVFVQQFLQRGGTLEVPSPEKQ
jgi:antitoxin component of RelBE/YafQ-DinJ toxin-antitoxin module